jgi:hypothetical protein
MQASAIRIITSFLIKMIWSLTREFPEAPENANIPEKEKVKVKSFSILG